MKAVLLFFVLLNALFFGWSQWVAPPPGGRLTATVEPEAEQLVLFREAYPDIERPAELDVSTLDLPEPASGGGEGDAERADTSAALAVGEPAAAESGSDTAATNETGPAANAAGNDDSPTDAAAPTPAAADSVSPAAVGALAQATSDDAARNTQRAAGTGAASNAAQASRPASAADPDAASSPAAAEVAISAGRDTPTADPDPVTETPAALRPSVPTSTTASTTAGATPVPPGVAAAKDTAGDAVNIARVAADPAARCVELGPFARLRQATEAAARLRELGLTPAQRLEESEIWAGHWVHLVPYPTRAEAIAVVEMLREGGINDLYIEPSGDMRNAVSLGLFSDVEGAEIRAGRVRRLGVKPQIRDRRRTGTVYWLDFALPPTVQLEPASFAPTPEQPIELNERACPTGG